MFTKKLFKTALAVSGLVCIAATLVAFTAPGKKIKSADNRLPLSDSLVISTHAFNADGLCICLSHMPVADQLEAPRIQLHRRAEGYVKDYISTNGFFLDKIKARSRSYFSMIDTVFTRFDLPVELKYLAVIESNLQNKAVSGAGAAGIWQLMPVAAKSFGLKVGNGVDERMNTYKSTVAAAKCLRYLHRKFDDWLLTLAAYNSGPGRVYSAIKKSGSRDFWVLQQYLPEETRNHVKKFIAMHYYFEGHGSLATLTKKETEAHIKAVNDYVTKRALPEADTLMAFVQTEE